MTFDVNAGDDALEKAIDRLCQEAEQAVDEGCNYIVLSDRGTDADHAPIPSLLATSAVHHHLIDCKKRVQTALVIETADAREVMHFALLSGYGASAINPYLAFSVIDTLVKSKEIQARFPHRREKLHKGRRQRSAKSDVEDGYIDPHILQGRTGSSRLSASARI